MPGAVRAALPPQQFTGYTVSRVFLDLYGGTGKDEAATARCVSASSSRRAG